MNGGPLPKSKPRPRPARPCPVGRPSAPARAHRPAAAFTLLELLVAMTVLSLLLVLLLSMVDAATRLWRLNENRVDSYREARAALNFLAGDLASLHASPNLGFFATQDDDKPVPPVSRSGMDGSLFFLTALPAGAQAAGNKSDLCTVGYFLGYDATTIAAGGGTKSYNLYRYFRGSDDTFDAIRDRDLFGNVVASTSGPDVEVLAKNITGFEVVPYTIPAFDPDAPDAKRTPVEFVKDAETPLPDMLEITIKAISNEAAKRFAGNQGAWENETSLTRQQDERRFTTRIYLPGAAQVKAPPSPSPSPSPASSS